MPNDNDGCNGDSSTSSKTLMFVLIKIAWQPVLDFSLGHAAHSERGDELLAPQLQMPDEEPPDGRDSGEHYGRTSDSVSLINIEILRSKKEFRNPLFQSRTSEYAADIYAVPCFAPVSDAARAAYYGFWQHPKLRT
ncbi:hypothetical protein AVEN_189428-1 [Araneus ventricosus]|uniref:Uncharacterized protein n=1 Tax=Araneus ventricosus TaxID=182803 RepID=A0A4Y2T0H2_ARAVE|nr:hypothetical protein AVEN_189428-1 [Araneus ventricosus]